MKIKCPVFMLILLILIAGSNAAYIDDVSTGHNDIRYSDSATNISLDGFNFTVTEGFGLIENESINESEGNNTESVRFFTNES